MNNTIILPNGVEMPHIGLGTYPMKGRQLTDAVVSAYKCGYRLLDTADNYYNEKDLGDSLSFLYRTIDAKRENMFLCSKVSDDLYPYGSIGGGMNRGVYFWKSSPVMQRPNSVHEVMERKLNETLSDLKTDYLDLYLMHWPYPDYLLEMWYEMEQFYKEGKVRAIGICNARERHFNKIAAGCSIMPMVNQFETSPINTKESLIQYCKDKNIQIMVYSPLMSLKRLEMNEYQSYLKILSQKYSINTAQVVLRYNIQRGLIPIPKSSNENRLLSNISIFEFELNDEEMRKLSSFNVNFQYVPESRSCPGL